MSIRNIETAGVRERRHIQNKSPNKGEWPILKYISLSTKNVLHYKRFLQVHYLATQPPKITMGSLWEAEGLEEEAKVCFISLVPRFSSSALPSSAVPGPP
jgi:hypothetical protein